MAQVTRAATLIAGILLLDYAMLRADVRYHPSVPGALIVTALAVQIGLASVWAAIGRDHVLARVAVLAAAVGGMWLFLHDWSQLSGAELTPAFWVQTVTVVAWLLVLRVLRFRTRRVGDLAVRDAENVPRFSIRDVLLLTTLICVALAAVLRMQLLNVARDAPLISAVVGVFLGGITLAAVWVTLVVRHPLMSSALLCAGGVLLGWGLGRALRYDLVVSTVSMGLPAVVQVALLLVVRGVGYRFTRAVSVQAAVPVQDPFGAAGESA